jgi:hypothetical protein
MQLYGQLTSFCLCATYEDLRREVLLGRRAVNLSKMPYFRFQHPKRSGSGSECPLGGEWRGQKKTGSTLQRQAGSKTLKSSD